MKFSSEFLGRVAVIELPIYKKKNRDKKPNFITEEEMEKVRDSLDQTRYKVLITCLFYTGLRWSEAFGITANDFNFDQWVIDGGIDGQKLGQLTVPASIAKGSKERKVWVVPKAMYYIMNFCNYRLKNEKKFTHDSRLFDFGKTDWSIIIRETAKSVLKKHVTSHSMRHSFATMLIKKKIPIEKVQILLGHSDISTTQIYLHLGFDDVEEDMNEKFLPVQPAHKPVPQTSPSPKEKPSDSILGFLP